MVQRNLAGQSFLAVAIVLLAQVAAPQAKQSSKENTGAQFLNPQSLSKPRGFTQVVVAPSTRVIYVSGQVPVNASGEIVAKGDFRGQVTQVMENLQGALRSAGASMNDVIKANYYVVNLKPDQVAVIREVRSKYFSADHPPAGTLVGVTALVQDGYMLEIEAEALAK